MDTRAVADKVLRWSPLQILSRVDANAHLRVLCYHGVVSEAAFQRQMAVCRRELTPVSLAQVVDALNGTRQLPRRAVLVTFDDGNTSQVELALPGLAKLGVSAVFFVVMGYLDSCAPLWWEAVRARRGVLSEFSVSNEKYRDVDLLERALKLVPDDVRIDALDRLDKRYGPVLPIAQMKTEDARAAIAEGHSIGNHSLTHPLLDKCDDNKVATEIRESTRLFAAKFPDQRRVFAYPNGNADLRSVTLLRELDYVAAFVFDHSIGGLQHRFRISRLRVNDQLSADRFATILSGSHSRIHHLRGRG